MNCSIGKVAIITRAASGFGRARAICLAEEGASLAILGILSDQVHAAELHDRKAQARLSHCEVLEEFDVCRVFHEVGNAKANAKDV
jgi:NADP-dependent 3-hydroxy acid dehydrogenase YdfG